eukprot:scaffold34878_cov101-Isochrysis_galbana.AAC.2
MEHGHILSRRAPAARPSIGRATWHVASERSRLAPCSLACQALCAPAPPAGCDALRGRPDACSAGECCAAHRLLPATAHVHPANYCQMAVSQ